MLAKEVNTIPFCFLSFSSRDSFQIFDYFGQFISLFV